VEEESLPIVRPNKIVFPLLIAVSVAGCEHLVSRMDIRPVTQAEPIADVKSVDLATIKLDRIGYKIKRGTKIGASYFEYSVCGGYEGGDLHWNAGRLIQRDVEFEDVFYEALSNANYRVVGDPGKLFGRERERSDFLIGGQITDIKINLCDRVSVMRWRPRNVQTGEASVVVQWDVYSNLERRVVYRATTEGYTELTEPIPTGLSVLLQNAFGAAASNLAAKKGFLDAVRRNRPGAAARSRPIDEDRMEIAKLPGFVGPLRGNMNAVLAATVTIDISESSHGSGFFITNDGYLLTNNHVVGDADRVRVRLASGTALVGRVLRRHRARDVALVKIDAGGTQPLPIRSAPVEVGEEVYAVGTPLERELSSTVTKGIVSAVREKKRDKLLYIQADVDIQGGNSGGPLVDSSGNLLGITVSGFGPGNYSVWLNFFIPIHDALKKLKLEQAERVSETR
jgi:S1-C subfamily serine protease